MTDLLQCHIFQLVKAIAKDVEKHPVHHQQLSVQADLVDADRRQIAYGMEAATRPRYVFAR